MTPDFEIEVSYKIFDNALGECIKVSPDADGLGNVEIDGGDNFGGPIHVPPRMAILLAEAISKVAAEMLK